MGTKFGHYNVQLWYYLQPRYDPVSSEQNVFIFQSDEKQQENKKRTCQITDAWCYKRRGWGIPLDIAAISRKFYRFCTNLNCQKEFQILKFKWDECGSKVEKD